MDGWGQGGKRCIQAFACRYSAAGDSEPVSHRRGRAVHLGFLAKGIAGAHGSECCGRATAELARGPSFRKSQREPRKALSERRHFRRVDQQAIATSQPAGRCPHVILCVRRQENGPKKKRAPLYFWPA